MSHVPNEPHNDSGASDNSGLPKPPVGYEQQPQGQAAQAQEQEQLQAQQPSAQAPQAQAQGQQQQPSAQVNQPQQPQGLPCQPQGQAYQAQSFGAPNSGFSYGSAYGSASYGSAPYGAAPNAPTYNASAAVPQKKSRAWIVVIVAIVALCAVTMFGMWSCSNAFSGAATTDTEADYLTSDAVAVINLDGTIQYDGTTCSPEGLKEQLDIAADNSHIKAVVLRVNSGGGVATAGEEMATYVKEFNDSTGKPVVVSSAATNASAAYEISSQANYIYVAKSSAVGAIGTAMQFMDYSGLMELLGITTEDITSADSKDSTYGTRALTDEERAYYQDQIDQINETFIETVAEGRAMTTDEVRALATGMTYTGLDAVENGLADEVGTLEDAEAKAAELAGCRSYTTITLDVSSSGDLETLLDLMSKSNTNISAEDVASALKELESNGSIAQ